MAHDNKTEEWREPERKWYSINFKLLPLKLHFLLFASGVASFLPFLPLHAKQVGLSSTAIGILYTTVSVVSLVAKPFFGWVVDRYRKDKLIAIGMLVLSIVFYLVIAFIKPIETNKDIRVELNCSGNRYHLMELDDVCTPAPNRTKNCQILCTYCTPNKNVNNETCEENIKLKENISVSFSHREFRTIITVITESNLTCFTNSGFRCFLSCPCDECCCLVGNEYITLAFWMFFLGFFFVGIGETVIRGLNDSICMEMLEGRHRDFGKQRLWFTIGYCLAPFLSGYLVDTTKQGNSYNYSVAAYTLVAFMAIDIVVVCTLDLTATQRKNKSKTICKDIYSLFSKLNYIIYVLTLCIGGMVTGFDLVYFNLFMEEIGASKMIIGISISICLFAQIPLLFFSGDIMRKLGHFNSFSVSLMLISIRFVIFSYIYDPLLMLPPQIFLRSAIDLLVICCISYAKVVAPPGTESTSQQLAGALFGGVGVGIGNALGGLGFDYYGSRTTYLIASVIAAVISIINFSFSRFLCMERRGKK